MTRLDIIRARISEFSNVKFGQRPYTAPLHHMSKEVLEAIESGEAEEYADILLLLLDSWSKRFPGSSTDELLHAAESKIDILWTRKYGEPDENGVYEHIRTEDELDK